MLFFSKYQEIGNYILLTNHYSIANSISTPGSNLIEVISLISAYKQTTSRTLL